MVNIVCIYTVVHTTTMDAFCSKYGVASICDSDTVWYRLADVGRVLGIKNAHTSIASSIKDNDAEMKMMKFSAARGGEQSCRFVTEKTVRMLVGKSRKPVAAEIAAILGMDVYGFHVVPIEASTLSLFMTVFEGESMKLQYPVGPYRIDMYFDKYKIAMECDENHVHNAKREAPDMERQQFIEAELGCTFVRYRPSCKDSMYIMRAANEVYKIISSQRVDIKATQ